MINLLQDYNNFRIFLAKVHNPLRKMMIKPTKKITLLRRERAQTMVEFALVFPIILFITYGIIEFGRMVFIYAAVTGAAREGARYGAASGSIDGTRYYKDCDGIVDATRRGAILVPINYGDITINYDNGPNPTKTWNTCPPIGTNGLDPILLGYRIQINVVARYEPIIPLLGFTGFDIESENARTILLNVEFDQ